MNKTLICGKIYKKLIINQDEKEITLNLKEFNEQENVIKSRIVLKAIRLLMGSTQRIEKIHIQDIIKLCNNNVGNKFLTPNKNIMFLVKDKKQLHYPQHDYIQPEDYACKMMNY